MKTNRSVLECPDCKKPLVGIGSKVARFVKNHHRLTVLAWFITMPMVVGLTYGVLGLGYGLFSLALVPFVVNYFPHRAFSVNRIMDRPYYGFRKKQKLGLSQSPVH